MTRITVYLPKLAVHKMEKMFIIVPAMEVNSPSDFKIKSRILSVRSKRAPLHATVSSPVSPDEGCSSTVPCVSLRLHHTYINGNFTVRREIILKTMSGAIDTNITMFSNTTSL